MIIIPAIDLRDGRVVRLTRGDFNKETVYSDVPEQVALKWATEGAKLIHVVDLDGALSGRRKNLGSLKNICKISKTPIEFGGGLRTLNAVEDVVSAGISRAVIGTKALDLKLLTQLVKKFGEKIVVGLDVKNGHIQVHGWKKQIKVVELDSFCKEIERIGVKHVVFTDVTRDGTLAGPNIKSLVDILKKSKMNFVLSGGISSLDDLEKVKKLPYDNLYGIIIGKALYEKKFTLPEAISLVEGR